MLSKLHVFFFPILSHNRRFFFHRRLFRLFSIDEQRRGNKSDAKTPTRGGLLSTGGGVFFVSFVRDVVVPSLALRVLALCVRCVLILFLDFRFVIQTRENTAPVVTKKNTSLKRANALRKRVVGLRRLSKKQQRRQQQRERLRRRFRSFGRGEIFLSKRVVNRVHTRARF